MIENSEIKRKEICLTVMACFMGSGFVSGQELWQYFGDFGIWAIPGLLLAIAFMCAVVMMLQTLALWSGTADLDGIVLPNGRPFLRSILSAAGLSFQFFVFVLMIAGAGTMLRQLFDLPWLALAGSIAFSIAVMVFVLRGVSAVVKVFSWIVPILVVLTLTTAVIGIVSMGGSLTLREPTSKNPLLNNWVLAALTFSSYNFLSGSGMLTAVGKMAKNKKTILHGVSTACFVLLIAAVLFVLSMSINPTVTEHELPMLELARRIHPLLAYLYAILLYFAMFGAALSVFSPVPRFLRRSHRLESHTTPVIVFLTVAACAASRLGFSRIIATVFPIYGYISLLIIILIFIHWLHIRNKEVCGSL